MSKFTLFLHNSFHISINEKNTEKVDLNIRDLQNKYPNGCICCGTTFYPRKFSSMIASHFNTTKHKKRCLYPANQLFKAYKERAHLQRNLVLETVASHGKWSGKNPFKSEKNRDKQASSMKAVVITRATLNWNRLFSFWRSVPAASRAIENAKGVIYFKGIGELPFIQQATVSIWDNFEAINTFAYKGKEHAKIVAMTKKRKWYKEDLFSRFYLCADQTIKLNS